MTHILKSKVPVTSFHGRFICDTHGIHESPIQDELFVDSPLFTGEVEVGFNNIWTSISNDHYYTKGSFVQLTPRVAVTSEKPGKHVAWSLLSNMGDTTRDD